MNAIMPGRALISLALLLPMLAAGCASGGVKNGEEIEKIVREVNTSRVLKESQGEYASNLALEGFVPGSTGSPAWPVRLPARTLRVWVPAHVGASGNAVLGHWAIIVVEPERFALPGVEPARRGIPRGEAYLFKSQDTYPVNANKAPVVEKRRIAQ